MNRKILALGIVITLIAGFVACKALPKTTENTATSEPTVQAEIVTDVEAEDTQQEETTYDFDAYTNQYKSDMGVTDEELLGNESLKGALYEWLRDGNISYEQAQRDKAAGCGNILLDDYIAWLSGNNTAGNSNQTTNTTDNSTNQSTETNNSTGTNNTTSSETGGTDLEKYRTEDGYISLDEFAADLGLDSNEITESLGGEVTTGEAINKEAHENGQKAKDLIDSGVITEGIKKVHEERRNAGLE